MRRRLDSRRIEDFFETNCQLRVKIGEGAQLVLADLGGERCQSQRNGWHLYGLHSPGLWPGLQDSKTLAEFVQPIQYAHFLDFGLLILECGAETGKGSFNPQLLSATRRKASV